LLRPLQPHGSSPALFFGYSPDCQKDRAQRDRSAKTGKMHLRKGFVLFIDIDVANVSFSTAKHNCSS
jgi:hypothetical protein